MTRYALAAALLAVLALGGWGWLQTQRLEQRDDAIVGLEEQLQKTKLSFAGCTARYQNILDDKESDNAVDRIPDDGLRNVPDRWLLP